MLTWNIHSRILWSCQRWSRKWINIVGTHTLARKVKLLSLKLREDVEELLQEPDDLLRDTSFVLCYAPACQIR